MVVPPKHPKMIIFSRNTHGFVEETHHFRSCPHMIISCWPLINLPTFVTLSRVFPKITRRRLLLSSLSLSSGWWAAIATKVKSYVCGREAIPSRTKWSQIPGLCFIDNIVIVYVHITYCKYTFVYVKGQQTDHKHPTHISISVQYCWWWQNVGKYTINGSYGNGKQWKPLDTLFCLADAFLRVTAHLYFPPGKAHWGEIFRNKQAKTLNKCKAKTLQYELLKSGI